MNPNLERPQSNSDSNEPPSFKWELAASVLMYVAAAWLIASMMPDYEVFAIVPFAWALHSAAQLMRDRHDPPR